MHYDLKVQYIVAAKESSKVLYVKTEQIDNIGVNRIGEEILRLKKCYRGKSLVIKID